MPHSDLIPLILDALDDGKGNDIRVIDVRAKTSMTDYFVIASGTSNRHVNSLADRVLDKVKEHDYCLMGIEGKETGEWVLVDIGDAIVHVMQRDTREFYQLEKLWQAG